MCTKYFFSKTLTSELSVIKQLLLQNHGQKSGGYSIPVRRKPKRKEVESERFVHCNKLLEIARVIASKSFLKLRCFSINFNFVAILETTPITHLFRIYEDENQNEDSLLKRF